MSLHIPEQQTQKQNFLNTKVQNLNVEPNSIPSSKTGQVFELRSIYNTNSINPKNRDEVQSSIWLINLNSFRNSEIEKSLSL